MVFQGIVIIFTPKPKTSTQEKNSKGLCFGHCLAISFENHFQKLKSFERRFKVFRLTFVFVHLTAKF